MKNLQRVCSNESKRIPSVEFVLYCPWDGNAKDKVVDNWHIQVEASVAQRSSIAVPVRDAANATQNSGLILDSLTVTCLREVSSSSFGEEQQTLTRQRGGQSDEATPSRPMEAADSTPSQAVSRTNPFEDAMTRGERVNVLNDPWMHFPTLGGNYDIEQLPVVMEPPESY